MVNFIPVAWTGILTVFLVFPSYQPFTPVRAPPSLLFDRVNGTAEYELCVSDIGICVFCLRRFCGLLGDEKCIVTL